MLCFGHSARLSWRLCRRHGGAGAGWLPMLQCNSPFWGEDSLKDPLGSWPMGSSAQVEILGVDRDPSALQAAATRLSAYDRGSLEMAFGAAWNLDVQRA